MESGDQEPVAFIFQVLEERTSILPHQNGVGRVVMDAELVADAMLLADAVERDPCPGCVANVVVEVVTGRPSGHGTLLDAESQTALFRLLQQWNEVFFEVTQVLIHAVFLITSHKPAYSV